MYGDGVLIKYFAVLDIVTLLGFRYDDHVFRGVCLEWFISISIAHQMLISAADHTKICRTDKSYVTNRMS